MTRRCRVSESETIFKDYMDVEKFIKKQISLLNFERRAEQQKNWSWQDTYTTYYLKEKQQCVKKIRIDDSVVEYFGRDEITFKYKSTSPLPPHRLSKGDVVSVLEINRNGLAKPKISGLVLDFTSCTISIACDEDCDSADIVSDQKYSIVRILNEVTYRRMIRSLRQLNNNFRKSLFARVLFGFLRPNCLDSSVYADMKFVNHKLNDVQKEAVKFALSQQEVAIIHGPPGTGKTTTIVEIIVQAVSQEQNVLVCAPSNVAVDNLIEKLSVFKINMIRLGHPARTLPSACCHTLDATLKLSNEGHEIEGLQNKVKYLKKLITRKRKNLFKKTMMQIEIKCLTDRIKGRKEHHIRAALMSRRVILSTVASASSDGPIGNLPKGHFDLVIIDECPQAMEAACWIPLLHSRKSILAGDHYQLPPVILSEEAEKDGLAVTLMERLIALYGNDITRMLTIQYRMNEKIMKWPSEHMYEGKLQAHSSVATRLLKDLPGISNNKDTSIPLLLINTAGYHLNEMEVEDSKANEGEADIVAVHVKALIDSGLKVADIAVVSPYNLQVELMKLRLSKKYPTLEINSVDGFQGREKEAVVLSLVRSNDEGKIGFLAEDKRINVALTRARRHLAVVGNSETLSSHQFLKKFMEYLHENAEVRSAALPIYERKIGNFPSNCYLSRKKVEINVHVPKKQWYAKPSMKDSYTSSNHNRISRHHAQDKENKCSELKKKYQPVIVAFKEEENRCKTFPITLKASDRKAIHELAEEYGLIHISHGEGGNRYIEIRKRKVPHSMSKENCRNRVIQKDKDTQSSKCGRADNCSAYNIEDVPKPCEVPKTSKSNQKVCKHLRTKENSPSAGAEDFDRLITAVLHGDDTCAFNGCTKRISYEPVSMAGNCFNYHGISAMLNRCEFCQKSFCWFHSPAEIHGCGDIAKHAPVA